MPEIVTRRRLPHWYVPGAVHFVTFRVAGSIPKSVITELTQRKEELLRQKLRPGETRSLQLERIHKQVFAAYDDYLDQHQEVCWLTDPRVAAQVRSSLYYLHGQKAHLFAYCILPNHVHVLAQPIDDAPLAVSKNLEEDDVGESENVRSPLAKFMHSLKSFTAHEANKLLGRTGDFWQHESYDHWVRDEDELERIVDYIAANPIKPGLAAKPHEWFWCSAHDRFLTDGEQTAWLKWP